MADPLIDPLAVAAAADVPNAGAPAAPAGNTAGANPFAGKLIQENFAPQDTGPGTPTPPPPAPPAAPVDSNPFAGHKLPDDPAKGTATAAGSDGGVSGIGVPPVPPSAVPAQPDTTNPFAGKQLPTDTTGTNPHVVPRVMGEGDLSQNPDDWSDLKRQVAGLPPKGSIEDYKNKAIAGFTAAKDMLVSTVADMANAVEVGSAYEANNAINSSVVTPDSVVDITKSYSPEKMQSAQRGQAMIDTQLIPGFDLPGESFFARNLIGKVLAMSAHASVVGAAYGLVAPKDEGMTTWDNMQRNAVDFAWQAPIFHGVFSTLGWPVKKALGLTGIPQRLAAAFETPGLTPEHLEKAAADVQDVLEQVKNEGANPKDIPEDKKMALVELSIKNAMEQPDVASLDEKTMALNAAANKLPALEQPQDLSLPDAPPGYGQTRIAQGVYQNPDGSYETYGYRGVGDVRVEKYNEWLQRYNDWMKGGMVGDEPVQNVIKRDATTPGLMNTIYSTPNPAFGSAYGRLHYIGGRFTNPLIIDNWHDNLGDLERPAIEANRAIHENSGIGWTPGKPDEFSAQKKIIHPQYGDVSFFGHRQPGVIDAARAMGHDAIIVRHGNEAVEVVALDPSKMYSAGAADHLASDEVTVPQWKEPELNDQQKLIAEKASRAQPPLKHPVILGGDAHTILGNDEFTNGREISIAPSIGSPSSESSMHKFQNPGTASMVVRHLHDAFTDYGGAEWPKDGIYSVAGRKIQIRMGAPDSRGAQVPVFKDVTSKLETDHPQVIDLGTTNKNIDDPGMSSLGQDSQLTRGQEHVMDIIRQHSQITESHDSPYGSMNSIGGMYKINGKVYSVGPSFSNPSVREITGNFGPAEPVTEINAPRLYLDHSDVLERGDPLRLSTVADHGYYGATADHQLLVELKTLVKDKPPGLYKMDGHIIRYETSPEPQFTDVTNQMKADPTIHPDVKQAALLHDAVSKGNAQIDLTTQLGPTNQTAAKVLAGFEPNPVGFSTQSLGEKLHIQGERALDKAAVGHIDEALLDLTKPREIDLERPELSNPRQERTKFRGPVVEKSRMDRGLGPESKNGLTLEQIYSSGTKGETALDGRIFSETTDEHIRNAIQMLHLGEPAEAAKRLRWAQEKNPIEAASAIDKDSRLVRLNDSPEMIAQRKLAQVPLEPWEVDVLKKYQGMMNLVRNGSPAQIERVQSYITGVLEDARARAQAPVPKLGEDQVGMLHIAPATQERAPWSPVPPGIAVPQVPSDWAMLARMEESLRNGVLEKVELPGVEKPKQVTTRSSLTGKTYTTNKVGSANMQIIFRIVSGGTSGLLNIAAANTDDPSTRKWLYAASGVTAALAFMPEKGGWFDKSEFGKFLMKINDLPALMTSEVGLAATDKLRDATDIGNYFIGQAKMRGTEHMKMFPTPKERELAARALDDPNHPAWAQLSHDQQQAVGREGIINHQLGQMLKARGIIAQFRDNYIRHIFPDKTYNAWRTAKGSLNGGGFTKPRVFNTLTDAENWAKANNLPGPVIDIAQLQSKHFLEVGRAIMGDQMVKSMKSMGLLIDKTGSVSANTTPGSMNPMLQQLPQGWVTPRVGGMHDLIAPEPVAIALERLSNYRPGILDSPFLRALDTIKSWQMRMVMAFPWIHGANVARGALALDGTGLAYHRAMAAIDAADPSVARALKHGTMLFDRPDYGEQHAEGFQQLLQKVGSGLPDAINNKTFQAAANFLKSGESALWDKWVPALGLGSFNIEMHNWTERTGGRFAEGTPEFKAAARTAADNANIKMGKSLQMMKDPGLVYLLRNIFFAPQWMESRLRITGAALGELRGVATGELPLTQVKMLPYKLKSIMLGATFTYIASRLWSGKAPQFNPNNSKFYIRTGVYDQNKREVGVDLAGWYADDVKLFSDPSKYFMNRLSPMIQVVHTGISGRDAFGRSIGGLELADQTINEFGPIGSMADAAARTSIQGGITGADAIKGALSSSDIGSSASLPKPSDLKLQGMAYRVLQKYDLPQDEDRIYELQQMMGSNIRHNKEPLDGAVMSWLAYQRRSYERQNPKSAATRYLFQQTQDGIRKLAH